MNLRSANSPGSADLPPPPPLFTFEIVLPSGRCSPATKKALAEAARQVRSETRKMSKIARQEKADELQRNLLDRYVAKRFMRELAELDREGRRVPFLLRSKVRPEPTKRDSSNVKKRVRGTSNRVADRMSAPACSSWHIDDAGFRGVHYNQSYVGRNSPDFYRGVAKNRWEYEARDEAVIRDADGIPCIVSNLGGDIDEIGVAWQAIEDTTTRKNGKVQIRIIVAFDADANDTENIAALQYFCDNVLGALGLGYSAVMHNPSPEGDERNKHAHILTHLRPVERQEPYCWALADEVRGELDGKNGVQMLRHLWAHSMSEAAERFGRDMQYTGLGYGARGLNLEPGEHLGEARSSMVRRGITVFADKRNRIKQASNATKMRLRDIDRKIDALNALKESVIRAKEADRKVDQAVPILLRRSQTSVTAPTILASSSAIQRSSPLSVSARASEPLIPRRIAADQPRHFPQMTRSGGREGNYEPIDRRQVSCSTSLPEPVRLLTSSTLPLKQNPPIEPSAKLVDQPTVRPKLIASALAADATTPIVRPCVVTAAVGSADLKSIPYVQASKPPEEPATLARGSDAKNTPSDWLEPVATTGGNIHSLIIAEEATLTRMRAPLVLAAKAVAAPDPLTEEFETMLATVRAHHEKTRQRAALIAKQRRRASLARNQTTVLPEQLPDREWFEANPHMPCSDKVTITSEDRVLIEKLRKMDIYVADAGDGICDLDSQAMILLGVNEDWRLQPHVQLALCEIREGQQQVMAALIAEARTRPLEFAKHGSRPWPNDLEAETLRRLDRWTTHWGFAHDMFEIEKHVRSAHQKVEEAELKAQSPVYQADRIIVLKDGADASAPGTDRAVGAFDKLTGKPTEPLLSLIRYVSKQPNSVGFDNKWRMIAQADVPPTIAATVEQWRADRRVASLVTETQRRSRLAGHPVLPRSIASGDVGRDQSGATGRVSGDRSQEPFG